MPTVYTANSKSAAITKAILGACKPCCESGSGSGSGSGIPVPCGCAGCDCCPGTCWWASRWHSQWDVNTPKYAATAGPYTMTAYSMSVVGLADEYYYIGDIASSAGNCEIGGLFSVDSGCNASTVLHLLTGSVSWFDGVTTYTYDIDYFADIRLIWSCNSGIVGAVFQGLYVDGVQYAPGSDAILDDILAGNADFTLAANGNTDDFVDNSTCSFTMPLGLLHLPDITVIAI